MAKRPTKSERRRRILAAARRVFGRKGYAATRMSDLAEAASVGKGTLYEYFSGKEDLFSTLVVSVAHASVEDLTFRGRADDTVETLRQVVAYIVETALVENLDLYRLFFDFWGVSAAYRQQAQERLAEVDATFRRFVSELLRDGQKRGLFRADIDPDRYVEAFVAAIDGMSVRLVVLGQKVDLRAYAETLQLHYVHAILADPAPGGASILTDRPVDSEGSAHAENQE